MKIRNVQTGDVYEGPEDAAVPSGYERLTSPTAHPWSQVTAEALTPEGAEKARQGVSKAIRLVAQTEKPQSIDDAALTILGASPLIKAGGKAAGAVVSSLPRLAPALGRVATAVGLAKTRGEDNTTAAIEGAGAGMAEGAAQIVKPLARTAEGLDHIQKRIATALQRRGREGWLDGVMDWMKADPNPGVQMQRAKEIYDSLKKMDITGEAARVFSEQVSRGARMPVTGWRLPAVPDWLSRAAQAVVSPTGRSVGDAAMSVNPAPAVLAIQALPGDDPVSKISGAARMIP